MMKVSLKDVQAIDVHAHPYTANPEPYTPEEFVRKLSLAVIPNQIPADYERLQNNPSLEPTCGCKSLLND